MHIYFTALIKTFNVLHIQYLQFVIKYKTGDDALHFANRCTAGRGYIWNCSGNLILHIQRNEIKSAFFADIAKHE